MSKLIRCLFILLLGAVLFAGVSAGAETSGEDENISWLQSDSECVDGHEWGETTYTWSEDNSTVTATRTCLRNADHIETETVEDTAEITKAATCETKGETTYTSAAFENTAFTVQTKTVEDVPAFGHEWGEATYTWNEDNSTVTATRVCLHDAEHVETETVNTTSEITKAATCTEKGETTYTSAVFENTAFTVQTKTVEDIPALGHKWSSPVYVWNANNSMVTAARVCIHDTKHVETETVSTTAEITKAATCTEMGETTYTSAAFENTAFAVQTKTVEDVPALGHEWSLPVYVWNANNSKVTGARVCVHDTEHKETEIVSTTSEITKAATCLEMGETTYTSAAFENTAFTVQTKTVENVPALGHEWGEATYTWADDYTTVTGKRSCLRDAEHEESETVAAVKEITKSPTETAPGACVSVSKDFQNEAFEKQRSEEIEFPALNTLTTMKLPAMLKRIESEAFMNLAFEAVIIPDGCVEIGSKAFADSPNLIYVWIPESVTSIAEDAFEECPQVYIDYENH